MSALDPFYLLLELLAPPTLRRVLQSIVCAFDQCALFSVSWTVARVMVLDTMGTGRFVILILGSYVIDLLTVEVLLNLSISAIEDSLARL